MRDWDVVYDDRGHFTEPHTKRVIGLGTLNVRGYLSRIGRLKLEEADFDPASVKTYGPDGCFGAVLYVEKEGFMPLFERVKLAQRYDIAIMSSKGMSVTAARELVNRVCDGASRCWCCMTSIRPGSSSKTRLENDTRRYSYTSPPNVIDLGLNYDDIGGLTSEPQQFQHQRRAPKPGRSRPGRDRFPARSAGRAERDDFAAAGRFRRSQAQAARHRQGDPQQRDAGENLSDVRRQRSFV